LSKSAAFGFSVKW